MSTAKREHALSIAADGRTLYIACMREPTRLTPEDTQRVLSLLRQYAPNLVPAAEMGLMPFDLQQPWFRRHRLLQVDVPMTRPPKHLHVALPDAGAGFLLTASTDAFNALAAADPPPSFAGPKQAMRYLTAADGWTTGAVR